MTHAPGVLTIHVYDGTRRCHAHPNVVISSPCGLFDALCGECEDGMYRAEQEEQEEQEAAAPSPSPVVWDTKSDDFPF
jgi:hypothetical protein